MTISKPKPKAATGKCPACGQSVKIVGKYKDGTPKLAMHERQGYRGQSCDAFVTRKDLGLSTLPQ